MGILRRIKNRLKRVAGLEPAPSPSPSAHASAPPSAPTPSPRAAAPSRLHVASEARPTPAPAAARMTPESAKSAIAADVAAEKILIYMKGTPKAPSCGFSAAVVDMFDQLGVPYATRDVVAEPALRPAVKEFTDWPTLPQVFVGHEFIGGADITREMFDNGELKAAVEKALQGG